MNLFLGTVFVVVNLHILNLNNKLESDDKGMG